MSKQVAFFIQDQRDTVVSIGDLDFGIPCTEMTKPFFMENDPDGSPDLCASTNNDDASYTGIFTPYAGGDNYTVVSNDFIGGHPPHRPS